MGDPLSREAGAACSPYWLPLRPMADAAATDENRACPAKLGSHGASELFAMVGDHQRRSVAPSIGVPVMRASGPEDPRARLGRLSHWRLGGGYRRVQVSSDLGHDLLGAADPRLPAA